MNPDRTLQERAMIIAEEILLNVEVDRGTIWDLAASLDWDLSQEDVDELHEETADLIRFLADRTEYYYD